MFLLSNIFHSIWILLIFKAVGYRKRCMSEGPRRPRRTRSLHSFRFQTNRLRGLRRQDQSLGLAGRPQLPVTHGYPLHTHPGGAHRSGVPPSIWRVSDRFKLTWRYHPNLGLPQRHVWWQIIAIQNVYLRVKLLKNSISRCGGIPCRIKTLKNSISRCGAQGFLSHKNRENNRKFTQFFRFRFRFSFLLLCCLFVNSKPFQISNLLLRIMLMKLMSRIILFYCGSSFKRACYLLKMFAIISV